MKTVDQITGEYFGYPLCCIREFEHAHIDATKKKPIQRKPKIHMFTGFIPCVKHCQQIDKGIITLESLITNRVCRYPFPQDGTFEEADEYINKQLANETVLPPTVGSNRTSDNLGRDYTKKPSVYVQRPL